MALFCYGSFGQVLKLFLDSQYRLANKYYSSENEKGITPNIELDGLSAELERELDRIQDSKVS